MVGIIDGQPVRFKQYLNRDDARRVHASRYSPDDPCPDHPDSYFLVSTDKCATCQQHLIAATP